MQLIVLQTEWWQNVAITAIKIPPEQTKNTVRVQVVCCTSLKSKGYENLSFQTALGIFFKVTTDSNVSRILAHVSSKFTARGLSDIFHRRTTDRFPKIQLSNEQVYTHGPKSSRLFSAHKEQSSHRKTYLVTTPAGHI